MSRTFGAVIIGDEILSGKRQDKHFAKIAEMLGKRGLQLSWVEYLGDDRARLAATFKRTMAAGDVVFSCGGIGTHTIFYVVRYNFHCLFSSFVFGKPRQSHH